MDEKLALEMAYKNGYEQGVKDFAERAKDRICNNVNRSLDNPDGYDYYPIDFYADIDAVSEELLKGRAKG
jgi:hypothetical protein